MFFSKIIIEKLCNFLYNKLCKIVMNMLNKKLNKQEEMGMSYIISYHVGKGGVGKTTLSYNGAYYLAEKKVAKVCIIDQDESCSMSSRFLSEEEIETIEEKHTVRSIYKGKNPEPIKVDENIDLIVGASTLSELANEVKDGQGRWTMLNWYFKYQDELSKYDYILIDTHNSFDIFVDNALVISDKVVAITDVDVDAIKKLQKEVEHVERLKKTIINPATRESFVNAEVIKVGNKIPNQSADDKSFREKIESIMAVDPSFYGYFEKRVDLATTKTSGLPITKMEEKNYQTKKEFYDTTYKIFDKIFEVKV